MANGKAAERIAPLIAILKLASVINRPMRDGVADPEGLSLNELRIMMSLGGEGPMAGHELAELMGMQPMNASRALATLAEIGWIEQIADPANRRRKPFRLSTAGWEAHAAMGPEVAQVAEFILAPLNEAERRKFSEISEKLVARISEWQPPRKRPHVGRA